MTGFYLQEICVALAMNEVSIGHISLEAIWIYLPYHHLTDIPYSFSYKETTLENLI
jgi:hypothetical protein